MTTATTTSVIIQSPPFSTIAGKEGIDLALVCAAFDQKVNLIFAGEGIFHLLKGQQADAINDKLHDKQLAALEFYDIEKIFCDANALITFQLSAETLIDNCEVLASKDIQNLISLSDHTVTF